MDEPPICFLSTTMVFVDDICGGVQKVLCCLLLIGGFAIKPSDNAPGQVLVSDQDLFCRKGR